MAIREYLAPFLPGSKKREAAKRAQIERDNMNPNKMWGRIFDLREKQLVQLDGFEIFVMPNDYVGASIIGAKEYEPHVERVIRAELASDSVFLDLGANVGYFTMLASKLATSGKVISFEPNGQNLQLIYASIEHAGATNVDVYPFAVSNSKALLRFVTVGSNGGVVSKHSSDQGFSVFVQAVVLDEVLRDEPRIDLVKMDIEAHEPFALLGMRKLIARHRPKIITEFHPYAMRLNNPGDPSDYLSQIVDLGYALEILPQRAEVIPTRGPDDVIAYWKSLGDDTIQVDLLARPDM